MPKVIGYTALRYGRDYLAYAIQSIIESIDEYHVLYAIEPSHGHYDPTPCPETRDELYAIASTVAGSKLRWHDGVWAHEGLQRNNIFQYAPDADAIIVLDSDEIYPGGLVTDLLEQTAHWHRRFIRVPFVHFYRSFYRAVIHDPAYPVRVIYPHVNEGEATATTRPIVHMGYAQRPEIVQYKMKIHGHKNEIAPDWFDRVFMDKSRTALVHPANSEYWNPEPVNPLDYMPDFMKWHPYYKMEVIE